MGLWQRIKMFFRIKTNAALDRTEDPREVMAYASTQQEAFLRTVKRGLIDVATAKQQRFDAEQRERNNDDADDHVGNRTLQVFADILEHGSLRRVRDDVAVGPAGRWGIHLRFQKKSAPGSAPFFLVWGMRISY